MSRPQHGSLQKRGLANLRAFLLDTAFKCDHLGLLLVVMLVVACLVPGESLRLSSRFKRGT